MKSQLLKKIAVLEALNEQLSAENENVDRLTRVLCFSDSLLNVLEKELSQKIGKVIL